MRLRRATGTLAGKRVFASTKNDPGVAGGSTADEGGCLGSAQLIGGEPVRCAAVRRLRGSLSSAIHMGRGRRHYSDLERTN